MTDLEKTICFWRSELAGKIAKTESSLRGAVAGRRTEMARAKLALYRDMLATVERHERAPQYAEAI